MGTVRKPFQGIMNILRFNWHLYLIAAGFIFFLYLISYILIEPYLTINYVLQGLIVSSMLISLFVSLYIYDLAGLYEFRWLGELSVPAECKVVNINAGFDETSALLQQRFSEAKLSVFDFYDPLKHTEVSIKRARKAYSPFAGTRSITTSKLPLPDNCADYIFLIFTAHEIRNQDERCVFFTELTRVLKPNGKIILLEHLRDINNFCAYNIGFFHFLSKSSWFNTFKHSDLRVVQQTKFTPFITRFMLEKNGSPS